MPDNQNKKDNIEKLLLKEKKQLESFLKDAETILAIHSEDIAAAKNALAGKGISEIKPLICVLKIGLVKYKTCCSNLKMMHAVFLRFKNDNENYLAKNDAAIKKLCDKRISLLNEIKKRILIYTSTIAKLNVTIANYFYNKSLIKAENFESEFALTQRGNEYLQEADCFFKSDKMPVKTKDLAENVAQQLEIAHRYVDIHQQLQKLSNFFHMNNIYEIDVLLPQCIQKIQQVFFLLDELADFPFKILYVSYVYHQAYYCSQLGYMATDNCLNLYNITEDMNWLQCAQQFLSQSVKVLGFIQNRTALNGLNEPEFAEVNDVLCRKQNHLSTFYCRMFARAISTPATQAANVFYKPAF